MIVFRVLKVLAWLSLAGIVFATLVPIQLRPHDFLPVDVDRALAFMITTLLFVLAYPRLWVLCAVILVCSAFGFEALQHLSPTRHAHMADAQIKAAGAVAGVLVGWVANKVTRR